ncbi:MAG: hypothetical protein IKH96_12675 [Ruminococcus sp.]|uniref:hypothetical protein n=1 Tax=Ruminococcus sp. TaxID=41978 RepID=UPI0025DB8466|nr:hypothetical protein [Ruminococcus sp.]MBR3668143.1 hypothetical protein [Ruminococcus sp.]MBR6996849.1 hypothetical protein [Ruminococcus sp.]
MKNEDVNRKTPHKDQGSYLSCFMCIGMSMGMLIGQALLKNMALGMGIGMSVGTAAGAYLDAKKRRGSGTGDSKNGDTQN